MTILNDNNEDEDVLLAEGSLFEREFFGVKRHNLISGTAERLLQSSQAKSRIRAMLDPLLQTMADIGGWADEIKPPNTPPDDEFTDRFLADSRNRNHRNWHFVNLPLDVDGYSRTKHPTFTNDTDVVQIARESILVLKGESERFEEINALRLLSHLVGDIHQPIHVGCGYIDDSGDVARLVFDPEIILQNGFRHDKGGNDLILPIGSSTTLHSYWDSRIGGNITDLNLTNDADNDEGAAKSMAIDKLLDIVNNAPLADEQDDAPSIDGKPPEDWVIVWAADSIRQARQSYQSLVITEPSGNKFKVSWEGKQSYDARCVPIVINQMRKAAQNLALVLDTVLG
ncbi:MAG TPA: S1/P1 nuclease [Pyrinomonadaceae bacterium]|nr:S1/P1 nuclease [Pyrinomonadaceae bacterium]